MIVNKLMEVMAMECLSLMDVHVLWGRLRRADPLVIHAGLSVQRVRLSQADPLAPRRPRESPAGMMMVLVLVDMTGG